VQTEPLVPWANVVGPIAIRSVTLAHACDTCVSHEHAYDHTTIVITGRVRASYADVMDGPGVDLGEFGPGELFPTLARRHHTIKALEPNTIYYCIFSHRDLNGLVVEKYEPAMAERAYA
jgi:hypothetical protein